jgi:hypothetical protein
VSWVQIPSGPLTKMKKRKKNGFFEALTSLIIISIIIVAISAYLISNRLGIAIGFLILALLSMLFLKIKKVKIEAVWADIVFGFIDNGVLVFAAILGANFAGVFGAILGGAAGNTITDGIGGLFEGYIAEHQRKFKIENYRTAFSTMMGKVIGCLIGAGVGLLIVWLLNL